jgi:hypothetical protein
MVVLKMLGQPHSKVIVLSSIQSGRTQTAERVGQLGPSVSVIVTQLVGIVVESETVVVVEKLRTMVGQVAKTAAREVNVANRISKA